MRGDWVKARLVLGVALLMPGCSLFPSIDFERMIKQDKFKVWQPSAFFADGRVMRTPPDGTIPRGTLLGEPAVSEGVVAGAYVADVPLQVTHDLLVAGRARFEVYCSPCHGLRGDGESIVAANMDLRRPPALAGAAARSLPVGKIYQIVNHGYGLMRSYAEDLTSPEERWAVVAYLGALQLSHRVPLEALPPEARREAERQLP